MAKKYNQGVSVASARFTKAPMGEIEYSKIYGEPEHNTTFNGGEIVPIYCNEVLPHDTWSMDIDTVVRQATLKVPTMDRAIIDIFAYFVPNRVVNKSWKNVMGENTSSAWVAPKVSLAPLCSMDIGEETVQIPVGSVADYYGFATQAPFPREVLSSCHDLKFRGYLEIYNNYFRDQNYQPPIAYSKLNVYNGFLDNVVGVTIDGRSSVEGGSGTSTSLNNISGDGSYGAGAVNKEIFGGDSMYVAGGDISPASGRIPARKIEWTALTKPLKANKLHDYFTSVLPSPQKGEEVILGLGETAPVRIVADVDGPNTGSGYTMHSLGGPLVFGTNTANHSVDDTTPLLAWYQDSTKNARIVTQQGNDTNSSSLDMVNATNLVGVADLSNATGVSIADLRMSAAIQQVYEILGRGGSRYTEYINSFFELDIDNPFDDIPTCLGHIRRNLDLYQTAQTSQGTEDSPQGNLAAFGYTSTGGKLFTRTFLEHGYIHVMAVVRHRNIYPCYLGRDNFRLEMMDFYQYPLANISEQPVYTREINPFAGNTQIFGYQEAWAELRMEPDRVSGYMRPTSDESGANSLAQWNYADPYNPDLLIADGSWLESNTAEVIERGTSVTSDIAPQFKAKFTFKITKERPLPTYSMSGLDLI